ncbi:hypothetical protein G210_5474 [Candida maltosa Xu316]|uniref:Uncharacterized protein n=1 Tax=Candida maltosa (strain Xu316) TaxID=1245528 RepID=M3K345_CANMX|nr:hypothetical protein G210_5474 [Candida maltosa Xu316]
MLPIKPSKTSVSVSTLKFVSRFLWKKNQPSTKTQPANLALADALNLLVKTTNKESSTYKPSLYDSLTKGSVEEQLTSIPVKIPESQPHVSDQFINNILYGIKSSHVQGGINYSQLYQMNADELHSFISNISSEETLLELLSTFSNHKRLTVEVLTQIILNKHFVNLDRSPIDLNNLEEVAGFTSLEVTKIDIILLKKHHDLKHPLNVVRNLKQNFESKYLELIKHGKLSPFYERIVWRFVLDYLKQYKEAHYIEQLNNINSSFLIWQATTKNSHEVAQDVLNFHTDLNELQRIFLKIASSPMVNVSTMKKMSIKYKISKLATDTTKSRKSCYALINELENYLINYLDSNHEVKEMLQELALYRVKYIQDIYTHEDKEFDVLLNEVVLNRV